MRDSTVVSLAEGLASLERQSSELQAVVRDANARRGGASWTPQIVRARGSVHHAAAEVLSAMDPRFRRLERAIGGAQLVSILLDRIGVPFASGNYGVGADEVSFGALWFEHGSPTFELTSGLMSELLLTDPGKVAEADVPWPFPAFRVQLPSPSPIRFVDMQGEHHVPLVDFSVLQWTANIREGGDETPVLVTGLGDAHGPLEFRSALHKALDAILSHLDPESLRARRLLVRGYSGNGVSVFANHPWDDGARVEEWFTSYGDHPEPGDVLMRNVPLEPVDHIAVKAVQRLAVNLALYLQSEDDGGKPVWTAATKSQGRHGRLWTVGRSVKVSREVREAAEAAAAGRVASCPSVRHIVRGHFREQAHGPRWSLHKRLYIKPFWKCQDGADGASRVYKVG